MWTKYNYLCTDCDALIEITTKANPVIDPACNCRRSSLLVFIGTENATVEELVTDITPAGLVKIDSNPYN